MRNPISRLLPALAAAVVLAPALAPGQPLTENFDSVAGLAAAGWVQVVNGNPTGTTGWFQGNPAVFSAQGGSAGSYAAANFNGTAFGGNVSTWLLTPMLPNLQNGSALSFYTRAETSAPAADTLEVRLSTNGASTDVGATDASVGDFTTLLLTVNPSLTVGGYPTTWTQFTVTLSGLPPGPNAGRIAFRHVVPDSSTNADTIGLDTLGVTSTCPVPPPLVMTAPSEVGAGSPNRVASVASIVGATYAWSITNGTITGGQGTNQVTFTAGTPGTLVLNVSLTKDFCPFGGAFANVDVLPAGSAILFNAITPCRLIDTRNPTGALGGPALLPAPSPDRTFAITGVCGVPSDARSVSLNVTVTNVQTSGTLLLYRETARRLSRRRSACGRVSRARTTTSRSSPSTGRGLSASRTRRRGRWISSWT